MIKRARHIFLAIIGLIVALAIAGLSVLLFYLSRGPVSLNRTAPVLGSILEHTLGLDDIILKDAVLSFDKSRKMLSLRGVNLTISHESARYVVKEYDINFSSDALLENFYILPDTISAKQIVAILPARMTDTPAPVIPILQNSEFDAAQALNKLRSQMARFSQIDRLGYVQKIDFPSVMLVLEEADGGRVWQSSGSYAHFERLPDSVQAEFDLKLTTRNETARAQFKLHQPINARGEADLVISNMRPSAIASLFPNLPIFLLADVPLVGRVGFKTNADGAFETGNVKFRLANMVAENETESEQRGVAEASIDFISRTAIIHKIDFEIGPHRGRMNGSFTFEADSRSAVSFISGNIEAQEIEFKLSDVGDVFSPDNLSLGFEMDLQTERLDLSSLRFETGGGFFVIGGQIAYRDPNLPIMLQGHLENLPVEGFKKIWPSNIVPNVHQWFNENVNGGNMPSGKLNLATSIADLLGMAKGGALADNALELSAQVEGAELRYLPELPIIKDVTAELRLRGNSFVAHVKSGKTDIELNNGQMGRLHLRDSYFTEPDFDVEGNNVEFLLNIDGRAYSLLTLLSSPQLLGRDMVKFDADILASDVQTKIAFGLPLTVGLSRREVVEKLTIAVQGSLNNFTLTRPVEGYHVSGRTLAFEANKTLLAAKGEIEFNHVPMQMNLQEQLDPQQASASYTRLTAQLDAHDFANLNLDALARRIRGVSDIDLTLHGAMGQPLDRLTVQAKLDEAQVIFSPLAYGKDSGQPSRLGLVVDFAQNGAQDYTISAVRADYADAENKFDVQARLENGTVTTLTVSPLKIGEHYDLNVDFSTENNQRSLTISGMAFDASKLLDPNDFGVPVFDRYNPTFAQWGDLEKSKDAQDKEISLLARFDQLLGDALMVNINIGRVTGNNGVWLDNFTGTVKREKGLTEVAYVAGTFNDQTILSAELFRGRDNVRYFFLDVPQAENLFKAIDISDHFENGKALLTGSLRDDALFSGEGIFYMTDFNIRDVPVMTKLLSLGSFTGIADTIRGEGIAFRQGDVNFRFNQNLFDIEALRIKGPAIGLTMDGVVDTQNRALYLNGTLVPAYDVNSLLGRIPIIGWFFSGERDGGLIGISYSLQGDFEDPNIVVNPLSLLTPGFLRNIFNLRLFEPPSIPKGVRVPS